VSSASKGFHADQLPIMFTCLKALAGKTLICVDSLTVTLEAKNRGAISNTANAMRIIKPMVFNTRMIQLVLVRNNDII
jgi:hypothetical protein